MRCCLQERFVRRRCAVAVWTAGVIGSIDWRIGVNNATSCGVRSWHYAQLDLNPPQDEERRRAVPRRLSSGQATESKPQLAKGRVETSSTLPTLDLGEMHDTLLTLVTHGMSLQKHTAWSTETKNTESSPIFLK